VITDDLIKLAATSTNPDGTYKYRLADLIHVATDQQARPSQALSLSEINRISLEFGRYREDHQSVTLPKRGG
jgi:hypothetical protein